MNQLLPMDCYRRHMLYCSGPVTQTLDIDIMMAKPVDDLGTTKPPRMSWKWRLFISALFLGPSLYFGWEGDYVLAVVCSVSGFTAFSGLRLGAVAILGSLGAIAVAIEYSPSIAYSQELRFTQCFGTTGLLNRFLCIGIVGLAITLGITGVVAFIAGKAFRNRPNLDKLNRWCGFGIGFVEGLAACLFFLGGMLVIDPIEKEHAESRSTGDTRGQFVSKVISATAEYTRASRLGPTIDQYNPFVRFPRLNKVEEVQESVRVLSDPKKIDGLLNHPSIQQLQRRPEVRAVVKKLNDDPEIQGVLQSGRQLDRSMAMTLLNHPAVLELLDQPGFIEEATKAIRGTNLINP